MSCKVDYKCESYDFPCLCQLNSVIKLLGLKWTTEILTTIGYFDGIHFTGIQKHVINISPNVLTVRLNQLEDTGLIEKQSLLLIPNKITYHLSSKGKDIWHHLIGLVQILKN